MAINVIFIILSLILNCPNFKLAVAVYKGFFIGRPFPCVLCDPYVSVQSGDIMRCYFWPVKAWDGWPSPPILKVGNVRKVLMPS